MYVFHLSTYIHVFIHAYIYVYMYICIYIYTHMYVYIHVYVYVIHIGIYLQPSILLDTCGYFIIQSLSAKMTRVFEGTLLGLGWWLSGRET